LPAKTVICYKAEALEPEGYDPKLEHGPEKQKRRRSPKL
jgi:hypothetical protein